MSDAAASGGWSPERSAAGGHNPYLIAFVVSIATFMEVLDTTIANVALALYRRRPRGRHRRKHLRHHQLSRRQRHRAVDLGLAVDGDRPQALLHDLRRDLRVRLAAMRLCLESAGAGAVPHPAGPRRRRHGDQRAGDPRQLLSAGEARPGLCDLRHRGRGRAGDRPDARRLDHRQLFLALDIPDQRADGTALAVPGRHAGQRALRRRRRAARSC